MASHCLADEYSRIGSDSEFFMVSIQEFQIKEIKAKEIWEGFLFGIENKTFLQSWNWGEFMQKLGEKVYRLGVECREFNSLVGVAQVIKVEAKRGRFLLVPHAPIVRAQKSKFSSPLMFQRAGKNQNHNLKLKSDFLNILLNRLEEIAKQERCHFIRIVPVWERSDENEKIFKGLGFKQAPFHMHPELTWELDLTSSEEDLLMNMRKTTRYLIRQGLKNPDLKILKSNEVKDVEIFNQLYQKTVSRHSFVPFSLNYLKNEFLSFSKDDQALIFLAKYKEEYLASAIVIFWQGIGFYHQGASVQKHSKIPASYLLQWEAIKEAKKRGCKLYNFWGVADVKSEEKLKKHPWKGLSLFKRGFGGYEKAYLKTQDLSLSKRYWLVYVFEKIRKVKRGF